MLEDDDGDNSNSIGCPEIDLLEQLEKMDLNAENSQNLSAANDCHEDALSRASSKLLQRSNAVFDLKRCSSKMRAALDLLTETIMPLNEKCIVVSQWTSVLNLFKDHLRGKNISFVSITGEVAVKLRNDIVMNFNNANSSVQVNTDFLIFHRSY